MNQHPRVAGKFGPAPDYGDPNCGGLCGCGCGRPAPVAKRTHGAVKKGQTQRFILGHAGGRGGRTIGIRRRHGLNEDERITLKQHGCQGCGSTEKRLVIDHDHDHCPGRFGCPGCIRGVLCSDCNMALGLLQNDAVIVMNLFAYLIQSPQLAAVSKE